MVSYKHAKKWFWGAVVTGICTSLFSFIGKRILMFWDTYFTLLKEKKEFLLSYEQCISGVIKNQQICTNVTKIYERNSFVSAFQQISDITYTCGDYSCMDILLQLLNSWTVTLILGLFIIFISLFLSKKVSKKFKEPDPRAYEQVKEYPVSYRLLNQ